MNLQWYFDVSEPLQTIPEPKGLSFEEFQEPERFGIVNSWSERERDFLPIKGRLRNHDMVGCFFGTGEFFIRDSAYGFVERAGEPLGDFGMVIELEVRGE